MARQPQHLVEQQRTLGRYLAALRQAAGIYQADIARAVPCHRTTVTHAEAGSQLPDADFWEIADQLVGANGALIACYDELIQAKAAHRAEQQAQRRARAQATAQELTTALSPTVRADMVLKYQKAPITAYEAVETARQDAASREGSVGGLPAAAPVGDGTVGDGTAPRRKVLKLGLAITAVTPEVLGRVLSDAAAEAMEFTQLTGLSAVGQGTLDHLELVVSDLNRVLPTDPPAEQFIVARAYRSRVNELIRGRHTLKELQALYVYAAWLSELLAWLAHDLGNSRTAQTYALDSYTYADEAGHGELCGWAANAMASITMYSEYPDRAARAAMKGVAKVSTNHPLAVNLRAQAARAYARLGQRELCDTLFDEAQQLHEQLPARAPSLFNLDTSTLASYAMTDYPASAYYWLKDFGTARAHGEAALAAHESAPPDSKLPSREAVARLVLAKALVQLGAADEAVALGSQALASTRVVTSVMAGARDLDRALVSRYPRLACVREFHEQYRHIAQRSTAAEEGS